VNPDLRTPGSGWGLADRLPDPGRAVGGGRGPCGSEEWGVRVGDLAG
jgi:hypothetical protein